MEHQDYMEQALALAREAAVHGEVPVGCVIVKDKRIMTTGYNGAPRGRANCIDLNYCIRQQRNVPRGTQYELCRAIHAEANAIIAASREEMIGSTLYLVGRDTQTGEIMRDADSCPMCKRQIINAGISQVVIRRDNDNYDVIDVADWVKNDELLGGKIGY